MVWSDVHDRGHLDVFMTSLNADKQAKLFLGKYTEFPVKLFRDAIYVEQRRLTPGLGAQRRLGGRGRAA